MIRKCKHLNCRDGHTKKRRIKMAEETKDESRSVVTTLSAETRAAMLQGEHSIFLNIAKFEHAQRVAGMLMAAKMWPDHIRSIGDALIILNMADRMNADPFMLAQRVYIVHGKPGLEGKLVISLINNSGKYSEPLRFEFSGPRDSDPSDSYDVEQDTKQADPYGCRAITVDKRSGKTVRGPKITWKIVKAEGWLGKQGSKWKTMAELMFQYRSASWFANINCPEVTLGLPTADELRDVVELQPDKNGKYVAPDVERKPVAFQDDPPADTKPRKPRSDKGKVRESKIDALVDEIMALPDKDDQKPIPNVTIGKGLENTDEWGTLNNLIKARRAEYLQAKVDLHMPQGPTDLASTKLMIAELTKVLETPREPGQEG
jgi:hypothetical protein